MRRNSSRCIPASRASTCRPRGERCSSTLRRSSVDGTRTKRRVFGTLDVEAATPGSCCGRAVGDGAVRLMQNHRMNCDCGMPFSYAECCGRYHAGPLYLQAPNAEALMRSRYSAYARDLTGYLLATWHSSTRPLALEPHPPGLRWLGLEVRRHATQDVDHATVEFVARSKWGVRAQRLHETSRFVREQGRWYYVDGDVR